MDEFKTRTILVSPRPGKSGEALLLVPHKISAVGIDCCKNFFVETDLGRRYYPVESDIDSICSMCSHIFGCTAQKEDMFKSYIKAVITKKLNE